MEPGFDGNANERISVMMHWKKTRYSLLGPLMIWVWFIIAVPSLMAVGIVKAQFLPPIDVTVVKTIGLFCLIVLALLASLVEIAPAFVTKEEVAWRNGNREKLLDGKVDWEHVPFLPPVLFRIRSTRGKRKRREDQETMPAAEADPAGM